MKRSRKSLGNQGSKPGVLKTMVKKASVKNGLEKAYDYWELTIKKLYKKYKQRYSGQKKRLKNEKRRG